MKSAIHSMLVAILVTILLPSCFPALQLYTGARTAFSTGAEKEMEEVLSTRFEDAPEGAVPNLKQILTAEESVSPNTLGYMALYEGALAKINKALTKKGVLRESDVLGNALTVKALAAWKLKRYGEAESAAAEAEELFKTQAENSPRDEVLSQAVPGLITLDMVYDSTHSVIEDLKSVTNTASELSQSEALALFEDFQAMYHSSIKGNRPSARSLLQAFESLDGLVAFEDPDKKSVHQFVLLSKLTGLKNWYDGLFHIDNVMKLANLKQTDDTVKDWINTERDLYEDKRVEMMAQLLEMVGGSEDHPTYAYWDSKL